MSGSSSISYRWCDDHNTSDVDFLPANEYVKVIIFSSLLSLSFIYFSISSIKSSPNLTFLFPPQRLTEWIDRQLLSAEAFPLTGRYGKLATQTVKAMLKRLIRVLSHIYYCHFLDLSRTSVANQMRSAPVPSSKGSIDYVKRSSPGARSRAKVSQEDTLAVPGKKFHTGSTGGSPPATSPRSPRMMSPRSQFTTLAEGHVSRPGEPAGFLAFVSPSAEQERASPPLPLKGEHSPPGVLKKGPVIPHSGPAPRTLLGAQREPVSGSRDGVTLDKGIESDPTALEKKRSVSPVVILTAPRKAPRVKVLSFSP